MSDHRLHCQLHKHIQCVETDCSDQLAAIQGIISHTFWIQTIPIYLFHAKKCTDKNALLTSKTKRFMHNLCPETPMTEDPVNKAALDHPMTSRL